MSIQRQLEVAVLSAASRSRDQMKSVSRNLNGYKFVDPGLAWIWDQLKSGWKKGELLPLSSLQGIAQLEPDDSQEIILQTLVEVWRAEPSEAPETDCTTLNDYNRQDGIIQAMDRATKAITRGDIDGAASILQRGSAEGIRKAGIEVSALLDFDDWEEAEHVRGIETGIQTYDEVTMGGPRPGDLGVIFGVTNMGKSILGVNLGYNAFKRRRRVLHIDTENGLQEVRVRYAARATRFPSRALTRRGLNYSDDFRRWAETNRGRIHDHLRLLHVGVQQASMAEVDAKIKEISTDGWTPELIVFDTPDQCVFEGNEDNQGHVAMRRYEQCKSIAQRTSAVMWAITQAKSSAEGRIASNKDVAWGYDKARLADSVLTINPGLDENGRPKSEKEMGTDRSIFVSKARKSAGRFMINLHTDFPTAYLAEKFDGESIPAEDPE